VAGQMEQRTLFSEGKLLPITNRLENLFFEIHSTLRDIDGMHADGALEELCKLLYLKSYVEDHLQDIPVPDVRSSSFGSCEEFASCLRGLLSVANAFDLQENKARIPEYEQSRGVFTEPFGLSSAALAKAFELLECYTLKESDADIKGRAFQKVLTKSVRAEMGQYFTPVPVCEMMVAIVSPTVTDRIMDPFCGSGHFLSLSLEHVRNHAGATPNQLSDFAYRSLFGIEKSDRLTRVAMTDMRMHGDGHSNIQCTDALLDFRNYPDLKPETFDVVLTNPPFGSILGAEAFSALADFQLASGRKRVPLEVVGLERSIELLRPGGRIAIVLPESIFNTESCRYIREWLQEKVRVRAIIDLPTETFSPFGANVQSGILVARKWETGERPRNDDRVCLVKVENLGYDASGRAIQGSEVAKVARHVSSFIGKDGW
ncbi:MAG: N-6 DNA methylase, partial [Opitutales bacterium]